MSEINKLIEDSNLKTYEQILTNLNDLKSVRDDCENMFLIDTSEFFTDKIIALESAKKRNEIIKKEEVYRMAKLLNKKEQYHRAALMLTTKNYHLNDLSCRYLAAKCYFDCKEYSKSLAILNLPMDVETKIIDQHQQRSLPQQSVSISSPVPPMLLTYDEKEGSLNQWKSSIELLKGYLYEAMNCKEISNKCFLDALELDPFCFEAFQALIKFNMISREQLSQLLEILSPRNENNKNNDNESIDNILKKLYEIQLTMNIEEKFSKDKENDNIIGSNNKLSSIMETLFNNSIDLLLIKAEKLYHDCHFKESYAILTKINKKDILNTKCLFLTIGCLLELKNEIELQEISHYLVETIPETSIAWYSVGCYYYLTLNMENARKYLNKSNTFDQYFQASMLIYGHTFEMEALHDQAIAVYLDLSKVMPQSYLPKLYVGIEYCHLNNFTMAEKYLKQALELSNNNLFVLHELGIVYYHKKDYENARNYFQKVYDILSKRDLLTEYPKKWETLINNIGHVNRKLGNYDEAIFYYKLALRMLPNNSSTLDAIGFIYSLKGELQMAMDFFQKALSLKRDDAFALTMFNLVFKQFNEMESKQIGD